MNPKPRKRSPLYQGPEVADIQDIVPSSKADGTPKKVLSFAFYDDVDTIMDQTLLYFSEDLDPAGIERAIRAEFDVYHGNLSAFIVQNVRMYEQEGTTPAQIRRELHSKHFWIYPFLIRAKEFLRTALVGFIAGGLGTLLLSQFAHQRMPPVLWSLRYVLLVLIIAGAHITLRQLRSRYRTPYLLLATYSIGAAVGTVLLLKGL
jgi:hypothetical protein